MGLPKHVAEILLVEDNPGDVRLTKELLKEAEMEPTLHVVTDGADALDFVHQRGEYADAPRPDLILLDLHLRQMDGEEVLAAMNGDVKDIPVIVLSGSQQGADLKLTDVEAKVDACMEKPLEPEALTDVTHSIEK
ncbi:response regulator [Natronolimnobius baerhuensis]|uniref:Response regulator n=1 Tax=Natronolimnobius baerhuensis TaxID=253108 RepID=A0A202E6D8_9EURY|nr:response regulator [Natronolimnobius baerhuensis]OVE83815.1 response regulator [Natronolimnobius baerhuensis]